MISGPRSGPRHIFTTGRVWIGPEPNAYRPLRHTCPCTLCLLLLRVIYRFAQVTHGEQTFGRIQVESIDIVRR